MNQHTISSCNQDSLATLGRLAVSEDGYIRLQFMELQAICLSHLVSGLDEESPASTCDGAVPTEIAGYTEWISNTMPTITIGWDWQMLAENKRILLRKVGAPRSNIMLLDSAGMDVGPENTLIRLDALIDALAWPNEVRNQINVRYGA